MKIVFTGGGSGGHFYPLAAIFEEVRRIEDEENIVGMELFYMGPTPYDEKVLFDYEIRYKKVPAGKRRNYFSIKNLFDIFKTFFGILRAIWSIFLIYPDVIVAKGGFASFPVLFAAKIFRIPTIIHESDTRPGRVNVWASKFAKRIAVSYPEAKRFFPKEAQERVAHTGQPVRKSIQIPAREGAEEYLDLDPNQPTVFILGGSQGAQLINETVLEGLPQMVEKFQIIHQVGRNNFEAVKKTAEIVLTTSKHKERYKLFDYLNDLALRMSAGAADVIVTRAGSTLFEVANWKRPAIIIPITESVNDHQRENAYSYARAGGAIVIEEANFEPSILTAEIERIALDKDLSRKMGEAAYNEFAAPNAARTIAEAAIKISLSHLK